MLVRDGVPSESIELIAKIQVEAVIMSVKSILRHSEDASAVKA